MVSISQAIPAGSIASGVGVKTINTQFRQLPSVLPVRIAIVGQHATGVVPATNGFELDKPKQITSAQNAAEVFGFGSPIHLSALVLYNSKQSVGNIPVDVFAITDLTTASAGSVGFVGTQTQNGDYILTIGSERIPFTLVKDTSAADAAILVKALIDGRASLPVTAGTIVSASIPLTARWKGTTGDEVGLEIAGLAQGIAITPVAMAGGAGTGDLTAAIANFVEKYTIVISQFGDTANLDALQTQNEIFWTPVESRPYVAYYGDNETVPATVIVDTDARLNERTLCKFPIPGSPSVFIEIASSAAALVAITSNGNPPKPYNFGEIFGALPGNASVTQWTYNERDFINKGGCSTSFFDDGILRIADLLTTFHPAGDPNPGFRFVVDISKLQLILTDLRLYGESILGKILVPDDSASSNPETIKPNSAKGIIFGIIDGWNVLGVIADAEFSKDNTITEIDELNANRLNTLVPVILSGSARVISIDLQFSTESTGGA